MIRSILGVFFLFFLLYFFLINFLDACNKEESYIYEQEQAIYLYHPSYSKTTSRLNWKAAEKAKYVDIPDNKAEGWE